MKKMISKYYCDVCGNECDDTEYILPVLHKNIHNFELMPNGYIRPTKQNICYKCAEKMAYIVPKILPFIKVDPINCEVIHWNGGIAFLNHHKKSE